MTTKLDLVTAAKRWPAEERARKGLDLDEIEARCKAANPDDCDTCYYVKLRGYEAPCCDCGRGTGSKWAPSDETATCLALIARVRELEEGLQRIAEDVSCGTDREMWDACVRQARALLGG